MARIDMIIDEIWTRVSNRAHRERSDGMASHAAAPGNARSRTTPTVPVVALARTVSRVFGWPVPAVVLGLMLSLALVPVLENWPGPTGSLAPAAALVFLIPVTVAATLGGWWSGLLVTVGAIGVWDWWFLLPAQSLGIDKADDLVTLLVYLAVTTLVVRLTSAMRQRATVAAQHEAELVAVLDVTTAVASTLDMPAVLGHVLEQVQRIIECTSAAVLLHEGDRLYIAGYRGPIPSEHVVGQSWLLSEATVYPALVPLRAPIIVADLLDATPMAATFRGARMIHMLGGEHERSWLWVPLLAKERVIGVLSLSHGAPRAFTARQAQVTLAIARQVALAIENARMYTHSRETAAGEERTRLARELHDSVTQMLFSSSLIAEVLPRLWERDRETAQRSIEELRLLTRGAAAEMRTLLVELRPSALSEAPLAELLCQLVEATAARTRIPVMVTAEVERKHATVPPDVQIALYRVAQEALTNAAKHARASRMDVVLQTRHESVELLVRDDGRGFDLSDIKPGHFGLRTMRERAEAIGAAFSVESTPGKGTEVVVRCLVHPTT